METKELVLEEMLKFVASKAVNIQGHTQDPPAENEGLLILWLVDDELKSKTFRVGVALTALLQRKNKAMWYGTTDEVAGKKSAVFFTWVSEDYYGGILKLLKPTPEEEELIAKLAKRVEL